ncbi:MAG: LppP/LprE family lipoprotein [Rhodococcus sp.]|nr:LppP/LprE family lipoprotein [Rhodococcus sp. (in: high G+C Gram-positive bacteria)]
MNTRSTAALITITAGALLSACDGQPADGSPTYPPAAQPAPSVSNPHTVASEEPAVEQCRSLDSEVVESALASLSPSPGGGGWIAGQSSDPPAGSCPALEYVLAQTPMGTASSPTQVLFFHDNTYLGTATSNAYAYTTVADTTENSVSVNYRWLAPEDANCCPSGGPATITYTWAGSRVVMQEPLPRDMLDSYGE